METNPLTPDQQEFHRLRARVVAQAVRYGYDIATGVITGMPSPLPDLPDLPLDQLLDLEEPYALIDLHPTVRRLMPLRGRAAGHPIKTLREISELLNREEAWTELREATVLRQNWRDALRFLGATDAEMNAVEEETIATHEGHEDYK
jgi:hypothetical protein